MRTLECLILALVVATTAYAQNTAESTPADVHALEKFATLNPNSAIAWENLGLARYQQQRFALAAEAFEHAQRLAPRDAQIINNLGFAYLFGDRWDEAITSFKAALEINSNMTAPRRGLCSAYSLARRSNEAVQMCLAAIADDANSAVPRYFLAHTYLDIGDGPKAIATFEDAARLEPAAKIYVGLAFAYYTVKNYNRALASLQQAKELDPSTPELLSGLGAVYAQLRDYKKAEGVLRQAVEREPDHVADHFNLGMVCLLEKNRDCALSEYNVLRMKSDPLAKTLLDNIDSNKVIDVNAFKARQ
jgi:tetratricopeptide (TPR) repeat protein